MFHMILVPRARVFLQNSSQELSEGVGYPAIVDQARFTGSSSWLDTSYLCSVDTSFSNIDSEISRKVWVKLDFRESELFITSVVNPFTSFVTPLDSFVAVLQILLHGDWGSVMEDAKTALGQGGMILVLLITVFGKTIFMGMYTSFFVVGISESLLAIKQGTARDGSSSLGRENSLDQAPAVAEKLNGDWAILQVDGSIAPFKVSIRHAGRGSLVMRSKFFVRNPLKASVDSPGQWIYTKTTSTKYQTMGKIESLDSILWDNGQYWVRKLEIKNEQGTMLPTILNMIEDDSDANNTDLLWRFSPHAAATHSQHTLEWQDEICYLRRNEYCEEKAFSCIDTCCPARPLYNLFDKIYLPYFNSDALLQKLRACFYWFNSKISNRVQNAHELYYLIQELRKNQEAPSVLGVDLPACSQVQLETIFRDANQRKQIEQVVEVFLTKTISNLLRQRSDVERSLRDHAKQKISLAWYKDELRRIDEHISRLEDIKSMIRFDLYSCLFLTRTNGIRKFAARLACHRRFQGIVFLCVVINIILQCVDSPMLPGKIGYKL